MNKTIVLGTGPSAFGACLALIDLGIKPIVIDDGFKEKYILREKNGKDFHEVQNNSIKKSLFGDVSMYKIPKEWNINFDENNALPISSYPGGLSSVWGANLATLSEENLRPWNSQASNLNNAFKRLLNEIPHNYTKDSLDKKFPWIERKNSNFFISKRLQNIINNNTKAQGIFFGAARNATADFSNGCVKCGKCLSGCPENIIFNSANFFKKWIDNNQVDYIDGYALNLTNNYLNYYCSKSKLIQKLNYKKIFIGCGAISSISLLQKSGLINKKIFLSDTQNFYSPILTLNSKNPLDPDYTLTQLFISSDVSSKLNFHFGIYESSMFWKNMAINRIGKYIKPIPDFFFQYLLLGIGFIPMDKSGSIVLETNSDKTNITLIKNPTSKFYVKEVIKSLNRVLKKNRFYLPKWITIIPNPGASFHIGIAKHEDGSHLLNLEGQPSENSNIHIIDSSALQDLQPGPVTLTVMANAYRITSNSILK